MGLKLLTKNGVSLFTPFLSTFLTSKLLSHQSIIYFGPIFAKQVWKTNGIYLKIWSPISCIRFNIHIKISFLFHELMKWTNNKKNLYHLLKFEKSNNQIQSKDWDEKIPLYMKLSFTSLCFWWLPSLLLLRFNNCCSYCLWFILGQQNFFGTKTSIRDCNQLKLLLIQIPILWSGHARLMHSGLVVHAEKQICPKRLRPFTRVKRRTNLNVIS